MENTKNAVEILNQKLDEVSKAENISKKELIIELVDALGATICDERTILKQFENGAFNNSDRFIASGNKYFDYFPKYLMEIVICYFLLASRIEPFADILGCVYFDMDMNNDPVLDQYTNVYSDISYDTTNFIIDVFNTKSGFITLSMLRNINMDHGIDGLKTMDVKINDEVMLHTKMAAVQIMCSCILHKLKLDKLTVYNEEKISLEAKPDYMFMFDVDNHTDEIIDGLNQMFG